jgi:hypothetical protein
MFTAGAMKNDHQLMTFYSLLFLNKNSEEKSLWNFYDYEREHGGLSHKFINCD